MYTVSEDFGGFAAGFPHPWIRFVPLFPPRFFCSWVTAWVKTLSRWAGTDRILVEEFTDNWDKIDAALFSKLGRAELITTITTDGTGRTTATIPLAGIDWDKWQAVFFVNKLYTDTTKTLRFFRLLK